MKRWLIGLAAVAGVGAVLKRVIGSRASDWQGLTEAEVRQKLEHGIPGRMSDGKRAAIADRVVSTMRDRGALVDEDADGTTTEPDSGDPPASGDSPEAEQPSSTTEADGSESKSDA